jgi:hypothetical protein
VDGWWQHRCPLTGTAGGRFVPVLCGSAGDAMKAAALMSLDLLKRRDNDVAWMPTSNFGEEEWIFFFFFFFFKKLKVLL